MKGRPVSKIRPENARAEGSLRGTVLQKCDSPQGVRSLELALPVQQWSIPRSAMSVVRSRSPAAPIASAQRVLSAHIHHEPAVQELPTEQYLVFHVTPVEEGGLGAHHMAVQFYLGVDQVAPARPAVAALHGDALETAEDLRLAHPAHLEGDHQFLHSVAGPYLQALVMQGAAESPGIDLGLHAWYAQTRQGDVLQPTDGEQPACHAHKGDGWVRMIDRSKPAFPTGTGGPVKRGSRKGAIFAVLQEKP